MCLDAVERLAELRAQILSSLSNEFRRVLEKDLQLLLPGRVAREISARLSVWMVDRAIRLIGAEMLQCIQPLRLSLLGGKVRT
jgi:hypothetical protein